MKKFNRVRNHPKTFELSLRKINTNYVHSVIAKIEVNDEEQEYFFSKKYGKLSDEAKL